MKKFEVHTITVTSGFTSMKEKLTEKVEQFLNKKVSEGYEVVNISFTYYEASQLIAFITLCK